MRNTPHAAASRQTPLTISKDMLAPTKSDKPELFSQARIDGRIEFEQGMSYFPPLTICLIVSMIAVFGWELKTGALGSRSSIVAAGALMRANVMQGESWRLLTSGFLHGSIDHLIGNCVSLYILGMACEHGLGTVKTALVYLAALLAGGWLSILQHPGPSVGASGAIFGVMGAVIVMLVRWRHVYHVRDTRVGVVIVIWAGYTLFMSQISPMVDNAAHVGGLAAGALLALGLRPGVVSLTPPLRSRTPGRG